MVFLLGKQLSLTKSTGQVRREIMVGMHTLYKRLL